MSDWKEVSEPDDTSHAGVTSRPESLEKLQRYPFLLGMQHCSLQEERPAKNFQFQVKVDLRNFLLE
jgi:hypothetical protein